MNERDCRAAQEMPWHEWRYHYLYRAGDLTLAAADQMLLNHARSPASRQELQQTWSSPSKSLAGSLDRLLELGLIEQLADKRYVTTHEGHVHGLMSVQEGVIFSYISLKPTKFFRINGLNGLSTQEDKDLEDALLRLTEQGYLSRHGNRYSMVPMPMSGVSRAAR